MRLPFPGVFGILYTNDVKTVWGGWDMERWVVAMKKADFYAIGEKYHISPILARLIRNRDIIGDEDIDFYLNGTIADQYDGMLIKDKDRAVEI